MRSSPRRRGVRGPVRIIDLTPRDVAAFVFIAESRYCLVPQIERECGFASADRCRRRIRQWFDAELVHLTLAGSTRPAIVSLTRKGLAVLLRHRPALADTVHLPGGIKLGAVMHHAAAVDVLSFMRRWAREVRGSELARWSGPRGAFAKELGLSTIEPDLVASFRVSGHEHEPVIAVEVDCDGNEQLSILRRKVERYAAIAEQNVLDAVWIVVSGAGPERVQHLEGVLRDAGLAEFGRVLGHELILARPVRDLPERAA